MKPTPGRILAGVLIALSCFACAEQSPRDLEQAASAFLHMMAPRQLSKSMFAAGFPDGTPSQFVSFLFSDMGAAEWPPREDSGEFSAAEMRAMRSSVLPAGVAVVPRRPDPKRGRQIVLKWDDGRGVVIIEGYVGPAAAPVHTWERALPKVTADPMVQELYRSNADPGASAQGFKP